MHMLSPFASFTVVETVSLTLSLLKHEKHTRKLLHHIQRPRLPSILRVRGRLHPPQVARRWPPLFVTDWPLCVKTSQAKPAHLMH